MKKYRIRVGSPIWWARNVLLALMSVAGFYAWNCVLWMVSL